MLSIKIENICFELVFHFVMIFQASGRLSTCTKLSFEETRLWLQIEKIILPRVLKIETIIYF